MARHLHPQPPHLVQGKQVTCLQSLSDRLLSHAQYFVSDEALLRPGLDECCVWLAQTVREIVTLERMHRAFDSGLMRYGMMKAVKAARTSSRVAQRSAAAVGV